MSGEAVKKEKVQMDPKYILKLSITLLGICLVVSLLLGLVNGITADKIAALQEQAKQESLQAVFRTPRSMRSRSARPRRPRPKNTAWN